jgi:hypothetical protein
LTILFFSDIIVIGLVEPKKSKLHNSYLECYFSKNQKQTSLVQSVERWFPKPDVVGSSPTGRVNNSIEYPIKKSSV